MRSLTNYPVGGSGGNVILRNQSLNFTNLTAIIYDARVTESTLILVYYSEATEAAAQSAGITSETNNGNITFTAANTPSTTIVCDIVLLSEGSGGGSGGTSDYPDLTNKPSINGVELIGNKTASQLGMTNSNTFQKTIAEWNALTTEEKKAYDHASISDSIDGGVTFPANKVVMTGGGNVEDAVVKASAYLAGDKYTINSQSLLEFPARMGWSRAKVAVTFFLPKEIKASSAVVSNKPSSVTIYAKDEARVCSITSSTIISMTNNMICVLFDITPTTAWTQTGDAMCVFELLAGAGTQTIEFTFA